MRRQKGFSLIELLIVVAIILIIAAIAIPNLLRARMAANESAAVSSIRAIATAEVSYITSYPTVGYAAALTNLGGPSSACAIPSQSSACLIDDVLATNGGGKGKAGYNFSADAEGSNNMQYAATAVPITAGSSGQRSFCSVPDSVVRYNSSGGAIANAAACLALSAVN
jgi:type IV pilus assembly protein PilA